MQPIAILHTCYPQKFAVPRQSGLVPAAWGRVVFAPQYRRPEAVRGLEGFSHLWIIAQFHQVNEDDVGLTVRPPRLGGNERLGVFATRSPFRPNRLALSVVKLERVVLDGPEAPWLEVSGVDMVDGTPVFDIKPYLPYADALPLATGGFADHAPVPVEVRWVGRQPAMAAHRLQLIEQSLALRPQPAYLADAEREFGAQIGDHEVRWRMRDGVCEIVSCEVAMG
jgi:tRNA-Thr(GGU) m(6)t(6)A37 methyltransferase TsaA